MIRHRLCRVLAFVAIVISIGSPFRAVAQEAEAPDTAQAAAQLTAVEIMAAASDAIASAIPAEERIDQLADRDGVVSQLAAARERQAELLGLLNAFRSVENTRPERLSRLRDLGLLQEQRLREISEGLASREQGLASLRAEWIARRATLGSDQATDLQAQLPEIAAALEQVESLLQRMEGVRVSLAEIELAVQEELRGTRTLLANIAEMRAGRREALFRPDQPLLFSPAHLASLATPQTWRPLEVVQPETLTAFARENSQLLLLHLMSILVVGWIAWRLRGHTVPEGRWSGLLDHPGAFAVFGVTAFLSPRYLLAPPLWDVVTWTMLAVSGAILASALVHRRGLRLLVVSVAAVYPLLLLGEALAVPIPIFRIGIAAAGATALVTFALLARRVDQSRRGANRARSVLLLASALSAAVLFAEVLGFDQLARWLLHATLASAFVVLAIAFLIVTFRGALRTLLRKEFIGRIRLIRTLAIPLVERLVSVLQVVLVIGGTLVLLDIWELAPAPIETWSRFVGWGFDVGGLRITVGRLLLAALVVYLAMTASWIGRTLLDEQASRAWTLDRGVLESINTLVHYALITLGILFGLGALGLELQNFAIVAGALGVGIGFGLQNVVNNFASGIILLFERPVRIGDTVEIDGEWGTIKKIGLRSTVVVTFTQAELIVPNADLVSQKVMNWTLSDPVTRLALPVGVAYGSDVEKVLRILTEAAHAHPAVVASPPPSALFFGFGDSSLDFELRIWVDSIALRLIARSAVLAEIDRRFREEGIEIPFPQRDLHIRSVDGKAVEALGARRPQATSAPEQQE